MAGPAGASVVPGDTDVEVGACESLVGSSPSLHAPSRQNVVSSGWRKARPQDMIDSCADRTVLSGTVAPSHNTLLQRETVITGQSVWLLSNFERVSPDHAL
jgi:hypothetical protein